MTHELSAQYQLCREVETASLAAAPMCSSDGKKPRGPGRRDRLPDLGTRVVRNALGQLKELATLKEET